MAFLTSSSFQWCNPNIALIEQIETNCCLIEIVTRALTVGTCINIQYDLVYYMVDFVWLISSAGTEKLWQKCDFREICVHFPLWLCFVMYMACVNCWKAHYCALLFEIVLCFKMSYLSMQGIIYSLYVMFLVYSKFLLQLFHTVITYCFVWCR